MPNRAPLSLLGAVNSPVNISSRRGSNYEERGKRVEKNAMKQGATYAEVAATPSKVGAMDAAPAVANVKTTSAIASVAAISNKSNVARVRTEGSTKAPTTGKLRERAKKKTRSSAHKQAQAMKEFSNTVMRRSRESIGIGMSRADMGMLDFRKPKKSKKRSIATTPLAGGDKMVRNSLAVKTIMSASELELVQEVDNVSESDSSINHSMVTANNLFPSAESEQGQEKCCGRLSGRADDADEASVPGGGGQPRRELTTPEKLVRKANKKGRKMQARAEKAEAHLRRMQAEAAALQRQLQDSKQLAKIQRGAILKAEEKANQKEFELKRLREAHEARRLSHQGQAAQLERSAAAAEELKASLVSQTQINALAVTAAAKAESEAQFAKFAAEIGKLKTQNSALEENFRVARENNKKEQDLLKENLAAARAASEAQMALNGQLRSQFSEASSAAAHNAAAAKDAIEARESAIAAKIHEAEAAKAAVEVLEKKFAASEAEGKESYEAAVRRLEASTAAAIGTAEANAAAAQASVSSLTAELAASTGRVASLVQTTEELKEASSAWQAKAEDAGAALGSAAAESSKLRSAVASLTASLGEAERKSSSLLAAEEATKKMHATELAELRAAFQKKLAIGEAEREQLHKDLSEAKGNIRVIARVRPMLKAGADTNADSASQKSAAEAAEAAKTTLAESLKFGEATNFTFGENCGGRKLTVTAPMMKSATGGADCAKSWPFALNRVLPPSSTQPDVFREVHDLVVSAASGSKVCIFAYGQTGAGKTHTMMGAEALSAEAFGATTGITTECLSPVQGGGQGDEALASIGNSVGDGEGVIPRSIRLAFKRMREREANGWEYTVTVRVVEIYNEQIRCLQDENGSLLRPTKKLTMAQEEAAAAAAAARAVKLTRDPVTGECILTNAVIKEVHSPEEALSALAAAQANRAMGSTLMNAQSSRSHTVFTMKMAAVKKGKARCNSNNGRKTKGTRGSCGHQKSSGILQLIDLAGSERLDKSGSGGSAVQLKEAQSINKSLSMLGDVIAALHRKAKHIPFRNSRLTSLLKDCLGGDSKAMMLVCLSPEQAHMQETLCSLRFAKKVNACEVGRTKGGRCPLCNSQ